MRFFLTVLLVAGLISGFVLFRNWREERIQRLLADECRGWVRPLLAGAGDRAAGPDEAAFFKLLHFLQKKKAAGIELTAMISDACDGLNLPDGIGGLVKESVVAAYEQARKLQLLDDLDNLVRMERGEAPVVKIFGWQDEKVALAPVVPAFYAPEAARHPANLQLVPACVRDAMATAAGPATFERARVLERVHLISADSLDRVRSVSVGKR